MGRLVLVSLPATGGAAAVYRCKHCDTHLTYATDIISRMFRYKHGKAYLFGRMANKTQRYKEGKFILDRREVLATTATAAPPAAAHPSAASDDEGEDSD